MFIFDVIVYLSRENASHDFKESFGATRLKHRLSFVWKTIQKNSSELVNGFAVVYTKQSAVFQHEVLDWW